MEGHGGLPSIWLQRIAALGRSMQSILPHGDIELTLWIALSVSAICVRTHFVSNPHDVKAAKPPVCRWKSSMSGNC